MAEKKDHLLLSNDYVHLHNHTQYSLLDGLTKIPPLIETIKSMGMDAVAITDHGTLSGTIEFYKAAKKAGIKPVIGIEAYVSPRKHTDKDPGRDKQYYHLIILAMNNKGYKNLMKLSTIANLEGFYYKPRIDHDLLEKYSEGLIVLSGCINGEVGDAMRQGQYEQAKKVAQWYKSVFKDRYYFELQDHGHPEHPHVWSEQTRVNDLVIKLSNDIDVPLVVTGDAHYLHKDDQEAHEILLCVQTGSFLSDENRMSLKQFELHVAEPREVITRWGGDYPEAIKNTKIIADRCDVEIELGNILIPKFPLPVGQTEKSYLENLVYKGLAWRYGGIDFEKTKNIKIPDAKKLLKSDVLKRAEYELSVINDMRFNGYFLIIADFINWGKAKGIVFGPGRGSAAGSIISYALNITELDPLKYDLLFERFLNPDRISMPDIDIDIQDSRRDEVIQYCIDKYGEDRVANIVTFGRMAARNAVRDVARVLQVPYAESDRLAKMIPPPVQGRHIPLEVSLIENSDLKREYETNEQAKEVFDLAVNLEGTIRSHGVHAAGVVIAPEAIVEYTPLELAQKGVVATQYSMGPIEDLGLLKMDFLGLSNLTIIKNAQRIIKKVYGEDIDLDSIPPEDPKTFELLQNGDTTGVFQLESSGMKRYLKELKPTTFDDIVAMCALYRPGPLGAGLTDSYVKRKNGLEEVTYDHPLMEEALKNTYGVLVYQEQVMQISKDVCGFTGGQADTLRKAVGKKIREVMQKLEKEFIEGGVNHGKVPRPVMERFWKHLLGFADYCFNKSHSACYGMIAYWTAYLKAHYPAAFMAALMTSDYDDIDRLAIEINECKHMGITVMPPDVNESFLEFAVIRHDEKDAIRFGMRAIKNVGTNAVEEILRARRDDGKFKNLEDFLSKVSVRICNRKTLESLVKSGAMDSFGDRSVLFNNLDTILAYANRVQKDRDSGQTDLFGEIDELSNNLVPQLSLNENLPAYDNKVQLTWERELLGLYLSQHPLEEFEAILSEQAVPISAITSTMDGKTAQIGGSIVEMREVTTKNGQKMAFVKIADLTGEVELILFPNSYQKTLGMWERDEVLLVQGKISTTDREGNDTGEIKLMVDDARTITADQARAYEPIGKKVKTPKPSKKVKHSAHTKEGDTQKSPKRLYVRLKSTDEHDKLTKLKSVMDVYVGDMPIVLVVGEDSDKKIIKLPSSIEPKETFIDELSKIFGAESVKVQ